MLNNAKKIYTGKSYHVYELDHYRLLGVIGEDEWIHSTFKIDEPAALINTYSKAMSSALVFVESLQDIILIGTGGGDQVRFTRKYFPNVKLTALEIDPEVVSIARKYFEVPDDDASLQIIIGDGAKFIDECEQQCDFIISDTYDHYTGLINAFHSEIHFRACHKILRNGGCMTVNVYRPGPEWGKDYIQMLQGIFKEVYVTVVGPEQYIVTLFKNELVPLYPAAISRATKLKATFGLDLLDFLASFPKLPIQVTATAR